MEENKISSDLIRGHIDTIILYSLISSDKFAQQISDFIEEKSEKKYQINQATLYSSLKRLESLKYVSSYRYDCEGGRRKFFKITPLGNEFVQENLSNWSYSRVIIDKLMGCEYTPHVYVTQNNSEKPIENTSEIKVDNIVSTTQTSEVVSTLSTEQNLDEKKEILEVKTAEKTEPIPQVLDSVAEDKQDINFRNILSTLIKNAEKPDKKETENKPKLEITDLAREIPVEKKDDQKDKPIPKFNETIEKTTYSTKTTQFGKADFSDLIAKYELEGYKIRVSSKNKAKVTGNLLINKLRFFSILLFMIIPIVELLLLEFAVKVPIFSSIPAIIFLGLNVVSFIVLTVNYLANKNRAIFKTITADVILVSGIVVFNLLLVIFALNFIIGVDLSVKFNLFAYLVTPIIASINIVLYYVIELLLSKTNKFKPEKNNN